MYFPVGWLCDKFSPLWITLGSLAGFALASIVAYFLVHDKTTFIIYTVGIAIPSVGWNLGQMTASMKLLPLEKFGQFSSAFNVFGSATLILANYLMGQLMDLVKSNYRMTFLCSGVCYVLAIFPLLLVYRDWKKYGGPHHYSPPLTD
jgi:MFS family permease